MTDWVLTEEAVVEEAGRGSAWRRPSARLTALVWGLVCLGLVMVPSASGGSMSGPEAFSFAVMRRGLWVCVGLVAFAVGSGVNYQFWRRHSLAVLAVVLVGLVLVLVPGVGAKINGARRWIRFGSAVGVQPSEFAKIGLCVWLAAYAERNAARMPSFLGGFVLPFGVVGLVSLLVLLEPDFGTAFFIGVVGGLLLVVCGTRLWFVTLAAFAAMPVLYSLVWGAPYRRERLMVFLEPWRDPQGAGYQVIQSKIATGSGGLWGLGLGCGMQKCQFLPGATNDFIFSIIAEELGFLGAVAVILAFLWLLWEGLRVALRARDRFGFALASGLCWLLGLQAVLNIAVATGSLPPKGLSLPFVSAGGSSLFFSMFAAGVLVNIARSEELPGRWVLKPWHCDVPAYEHAFGDFLRVLGRRVGVFSARGRGVYGTG